MLTPRLTDQHHFRRIPILFDRWYAVLSGALGLAPSSSYLQLTDDVVHVRMGWAFRAAFPRSAVASTEIAGWNVMSRGVHGFAGRWLVNGSGRGIVILNLNPAQRCHVLGLPLRLRRLMVSVAAPEELVTAILSAPPREPVPRRTL
jgi:hypothetical protein